MHEYGHRGVDATLSPLGVCIDTNGGSAGFEGAVFYADDKVEGIVLRSCGDTVHGATVGVALRCDVCIL